VTITRGHVIYSLK